MNRAEDAARLVIEAVLGSRVSDVADDAARDAGVIDLGLGRNLASDDYQAGCQQRLARNARRWVLSQRGVENRVRYLVGDLVGVTLGDRLRSKQSSVMIIQ